MFEVMQFRMYYEVVLMFRSGIYVLLKSLHNIFRSVLESTYGVKSEVCNVIVYAWRGF